jgi:hypothetical protein
MLGIGLGAMGILLLVLLLGPFEFRARKQRYWRIP